MAGFLVIFPPLVVGLELDFCDSIIFDHFTCDSAHLLQIILQRHQHFGAHELYISFGHTYDHTDADNSLLHLYSQNYSEISLSQTKGKGLCNLLLTHDCCLHILWKLHLHVCENICQGWSRFDKGGGYAQHLCCPHAQSFYLHFKEPTGETSI